MLLPQSSGQGGVKAAPAYDDELARVEGASVAEKFATIGREGGATQEGGEGEGEGGSNRDARLVGR